MSKIMELVADYAQECKDFGHLSDSPTRAALAAEVEKIEWLATATHIVMAERDGLREKLDLVEKDAARYRWLRERDDWVLMPGMRSEVCLRSNLDYQIDMSMGAFIGATK